MNGKSNISSFMPPGYIQEDPERLIEMENINLNTDVKFRNCATNDLIQTEEKPFKTHHPQEVSGSFQEKSPDVWSQAKARPPDEELLKFQSNEQPEILHGKRVTYNEDINRKASSIASQESLHEKGLFSCLRSCFNHKKKFTKIKVYFGPNATQDAIYKHPNNHVRTTKCHFFYSSSFFLNFP